MLLIGRKEGQGVYIGRGVRVTVVEVRSDGGVRLSIEAPKFMAVTRDDFTQEEHLRAQAEREQRYHPRREHDSSTSS